ncbi:DUF7674 family protein [Candidatus Neptunichlamydia sp. REUL1]|uniref:DUF7674 family protein n=1 Tax=Candidatus Neptunichlamydia sp. REUL1 TaxID=3064277 RepID=UPI00292DBE1F|nr:hypothetical protein [Candidatus Neptunochlamydia sp. REUL1]
MKEITEEKCIELMKEKFPKFLPYWEKYVEEEGLDDGITIKVIPFAEYTIDRLNLCDDLELGKIFDLVEFLLNRGDQSVQNAMATGYLECLMHKDPNEIKFRGFVKFLGKHSLEYCKAWDKFTGVRTDGLWDEEVI